VNSYPTAVNASMPPPDGGFWIGADVAQAVKLAGPRDIVQLISYTTHRASFDRITEAAGLQLER